jgi:predicted site-specific integrase-resolvase
MREYLENLRREYVKNTLDTKKVCLNIVRMLNHGDDEELANAIAAVNSYYQEHLYSEEKRKRRRKRKF